MVFNIDTKLDKLAKVIMDKWSSWRKSKKEDAFEDFWNDFKLEYIKKYGLDKFIEHYDSKFSQIC